VTFTFAADETGHTFVLTGADSYGTALSENITGTSAGIVSSANQYHTIAAVTTLSATTGNVSIGTGVSATSNPIRTDDFLVPGNITVALEVTATASFTVQNSVDPLNSPGFDPSTAVWIDHTTLANVSATAESNYAFPPVYVRCKLNSSSGSGAGVMTLVQAGL
jgi:hypothetical protein